MSEPNYDSITPICKVGLDTDFQLDKFVYKGCDLSFLDGLKWKGYVRLKFKTPDNYICPRNSTINGQMENEYIYKPRSSGSSAYYTDSDYDYAYIRRQHVQHPLDELTMSSKSVHVDSKILPNTCITKFGDYLQKYEIKDLVEDESESEDHSRKDSLEFLNYKDEHYLNSKEFLCYFADLLRHRKVLDSDLVGATYKGASIFTKKYEIIPAVHVAHDGKNWPQCAYNFKHRKRNISVNDLTEQKFQWPTLEMIKKIESFGYHVIPLPYISKVKKNPFRELEWKIVFPKAERYLESNLSNTQIKLFTLVKVLLKTFMEPYLEEDSINPTIDYIRNFLFWECEKNFSAWPEGFLGEILMRFLKGFLRCITEKLLPDFFVYQRNLFESIPDSFLNNVSGIINTIISNPTMHILLAYRNLSPTEEEFLPKINYQKVYRNLTLDDYMGLKLHSIKGKSLKENRMSHIQHEQPTAETVVPVFPVIAEGLIGKISIKTTGKMRRETLVLRNQIERRRLEDENRRPSVDSINTEVRMF